MKLEYKNGLIFASIMISYNGRTKIIDNVVIDTGASESIIFPDIVDDLGGGCRIGR